MRQRKAFFKGRVRRFGATHLEVGLEEPSQIAERLSVLSETDKKEAVRLMDKMGHPLANLVAAELFPLNA